MSDLDVIRTKIEELEGLAEEIENLGRELILNMPIITVEDPDLMDLECPYLVDKWGIPSENIRSLQRKALRKYQQWSSGALFFIHEYLPEKEKEFGSYYRISDRGVGVLDYLECYKTDCSGSKEKVIHEFWSLFENQRSILLAVPGIIEVKALRLRETLSAAYVEREIDEAEYLYRHDHVRAAGALAGVALEMHLRTICDKHRIEYGHKDTIEPLLQNLYKNKKIDVTELKRIQFLASIRDKCDHASDVEKGEVKELIEKVKTFVSRPV